jgi:3'(2'), 5'-bisphosphate nucleotidase
MNSTDFQEYLAPARDIAREAGEIILAHPVKQFGFTMKTDPKTGRPSRSTPGEIKANDYIVQKLHKLTPHIPIIAEEDSEEKINNPPPIPAHGMFWLVDPLDGTTAFTDEKKEYTVNIGLIKDGKPVLGVVYAPAHDVMYYASKSHDAFRMKKSDAPEKIHVLESASDGYVVVKSESHMDAKTQAYLDTLNLKDVQPVSSSLKFCLVADGSAHIYPRLGTTMEWDTAAGHAILEAAAGRIETDKGIPLTYGKPDFTNPGFIASHGPVVRKNLAAPGL